MKEAKWKVLSIVLFLSLVLISCAGTQKRDIEGDLIAAMSRKCKTVEIKVDREKEVYIIDPTERFSENGCSIALIRGWKEGILIMKKEVEVCACGKRAY